MLSGLYKLVLRFSLATLGFLIPLMELRVLGAVRVKGEKKEVDDCMYCIVCIVGGECGIDTYHPLHKRWKRCGVDW